MTDDLRVEVLEGALEDAVEETRAWEQQLAPRAPGAGSRGYHGADFIVDRKAWTRKRDTRAMLVGPDHRLARHLMFQEFGTIYHPAQPFIRPVVRKMRPRTLEIVADHAKRAVGL
jgi:HK97 gp10 family phage protein